MIIGCNKMNKVFIVVECTPYEGDTVLRVFAKYADAVSYAFDLTVDTKGTYDIFEREVY